MPDEENPRVHSLKKRKDPYASLMRGEEEEEPPEKENEDTSFDEDVKPISHSNDSSSRGGDPSVDESDEYADLLVEEGTHEEGIHSGQEMVEDENPTNPPMDDVSKTPAISRERIKNQLILKSQGHGMDDPSNAMKLELLEIPGKNALFIGRKKNIAQRSGTRGGLYVGRVQDDERYRDHKLYLDSLNPHVVFICGARGSGKCLTGDTLITLDDGSTIPIQELEEKKQNVLGLNHDLKMQPLFREGFYSRTVEKIVKVRLRSGKEIKLTPEHPLLTIDGWKPAETLDVGSRIATPRILPVFGNKTMRGCDVKLMAYLLTEGHLGNHFVIFSNEDPIIQGEFFKSVEEFDSNLHIKIHSKEGCFRVVQKRKQVDTSTLIRNEKGQFTDDGHILHKKSSMMQWLDNYGIYNKKSIQKFIPSEFMQLSKEDLSLFLNRMFSCDGTIFRVNKGKNWCVGYASSSEKMIRQVHHLLLRFGILSTLRSKTVRTNGKDFPVFEIVLYGENVLKFIAQIGFLGSKSEKAETAIIDMLGLERNPNTDTIPKDVWNQFEVRNWAQTGREMGYSSPKSLSHTVAYAPSREKLLKIAQIQENKGIQLLAQSDIFWDEMVEKIEINETTQVYDISVPTHHNFVANDIIVHNSYVLGVMAEELALQNKDVGVVVVDPVGVFWSMRFPNKEEKEVKELPHFDLMPQGLDNLRVFIPDGMKNETPKSTYDSLFSIPPALLTSEDWCLTFGIERFSPTGLLMEKALKKVEKGYRLAGGESVKGKKGAYSLTELIACLETDAELNSKERGYRADSIRALVSRFEAAKGWGIFSEKGTPLSEISKAGQLTVIDTSFLDDTVTALVIGILARRLLAARKLQTRKEAAEEVKEKSVESLLENEIPPTWLFIDEAHTLIPGGNVSTPATSAIVEYVKQGRRPGCSLVFATQQPSAIDSRVLSQLDVIMSHKLIFDDDIKAVSKRTPTIIPLKYKHPHFLKTLPVGTALVGDRREETNRAFVLKIRPRMSQHEGRDAETGERKKELTEGDAQRLVVELLMSTIEKEGVLDKETIEHVIDAMNQKYHSTVMLSHVLDDLEGRGARINPKDESVRLPGIENPLSPPHSGKGDSFSNEKAAEARVEALTKLIGPDRMEEEESRLQAFPIMQNKEQVVHALEKAAKKGLLGLGGPSERLQEIQLKYWPVWKVDYRQFTGKTSYITRSCYIDAEKGEFLHFLNNQFITSQGLNAVDGLAGGDLALLRDIASHPKQRIPEMARRLRVDEKVLKRSLVKLVDRKLIRVTNEEKDPHFSIDKQLDLPLSGSEKALSSIRSIKLTEVPSVSAERVRVSEEKIHALLTEIWPSVAVTNVSPIYRPVFEATLHHPQRNEYRTILLDGFTGKIIE